MADTTIAAVPTDPAALPGPRGLPLLGNVLGLRPTRAHLILEAWAREYGPFFTFKLGPRRIVGVADAEAVQTLLRERPEKFTRQQPIGEVMSEMGFSQVFQAEGEQWRRHRRVWLHTMNAHRVRPFFGRMTEITGRLRRRWEEAASTGDAVDVVEDLMRYTVDVVTLFAFGHDANTIEQGDDVVQRHMQHVFPAINRRINSPFPYWRYLPLPADLRLRRALRELEEFVMVRIEEARARMAADPGLRESPENLLEGLIAAGEGEEEGLSDHEIFGNTTAALLAGEDTTAYTIAWMIHELMRHPAELAELRAEVDRVLGDAALWSELEQGDELSYLGAVLSETLRLRPVAPMQGMTAKEEVELDGRRFPAGTNFLVSMRTLALDEGRYPDARTFRPQRWLEGKPGHFTRHPPYPFGGGKRTCPGMNLAMLEIRSVIAMLVRNFDFEPPPDGPPVREKFNFTMRPENLRMRLQSRAK